MLLFLILLMGEGGAGYPPLPPLSGDATTDIIRVKRHRTMPHRGG